MKKSCYSMYLAPIKKGFFKKWVYVYISLERQVETKVVVEV